MMNRFPALACLVVSALPLLGLLLAGCCLGTCHSCKDCFDKDRVCYPEAKPAKKEITGWDVECKDVCIPSIACPWQDCNTPRRCGRVRRVAVLKKETKSCESCEYEWKIPSCEPPKAADDSDKDSRTSDGKKATGDKKAGETTSDGKPKPTASPLTPTPPYPPAPRP